MNFRIDTNGDQADLLVSIPLYVEAQHDAALYKAAFNEGLFRTFEDQPGTTNFFRWEFRWNDKGLWARAYLGNRTLTPKDLNQVAERVSTYCQGVVQVLADLERATRAIAAARKLADNEG